jgi:TP901 family phage tail tape measure protein
MIGVGLLAAAGFGVAVVSAAKFEEQLSRFKAVTDTPTKSMEAIRQKALQLGRDSAFGAMEVVQGFVELGKAGLTAQDILAGVGDAAVNLAGAGELDMARSTEILVNAMRTFKIPAEGATHIADRLAGAANASTSEVDDLAVSLRYAGPVAAAAGVSFDDLSTVLAVFANVGIKGSTAGTTLRGVILGLVAPTTKGAATMKELGITTDGGANSLVDATGKIKPLGDVFQILQDKTKGLSASQRISALNAIFQRRALAGAVEAALQGKDGFAAMNKQIGNVTAHQVLKTKLDNLAGSFKILKSSIETLLISAGSPIQKTLKKWVDGFREVINWIAKLSPKTLSLITNILGIAAVILIVGGSFLWVVGKILQMYRVIKDLIAAVKLFTAAMKVLGLSFLTNPVFLIIAGLVLLAIAFYLLYTRVKGFREFIDATWQFIQKGAKAFWKFLEPILGAVADAFVAMWEVIQPPVKALVKFFTDEVEPKLSKIFKTISDNWRLFATVFGGPIGIIIAHFETLKDIVLTVFNFIVDNWKTLAAIVFLPLLGPIGLIIGALKLFGASWSDIWNGIVGLVKGAMDILTPFWDVVAGTFILPILKEAWTQVKETISGVLSIISGLIDIFVGVFTGNWSEAWQGLKDVVSGVWRVILAVVRGAFGQILALFRTGLKLIPLLWNLAWKALTAVVGFVWNTIVTIVTNAFSLLIGLLSSGAQLVGGLIISAFDALVTFIGELPRLLGFAIGFLLGFLISLPQRIAEFLAQVIPILVEWGVEMAGKALQIGLDIVTAIGNFLLTLPGKMADWLTAAIKSIQDFVSAAVPKAIEFGSNFVNFIISFISQLPGKLGQFLLTTLSNIGNFISDAIGKAAHFGQDFFNWIVNSITGLPGKVGEILDKVISAIKGAITGAFNAVKNFAEGLWDGFKEGLGINSPSYIEKAADAINENLLRNAKKIKEHIRTMQNLSSGIPKNLAVMPQLAIGAGAIKVASVPQPTQVHVSTPPSSADEINIDVHTDADPEEIVRAYSFAKRLR